MEVATYPEFQRDDFAVVAQPALTNLSLPLASDGYVDTTYLSSDCFHISQKTNAVRKFTKDCLRRDSLINNWKTDLSYLKRILLIILYKNILYKKYFVFKISILFLSYILFLYLKNKRKLETLTMSSSFQSDMNIIVM